MADGDYDAGARADHGVGLVTLPYPLAPDLAMYRLAHTIHVTAAIALAVLVLLHGAAALAHALSRRQYLRRARCSSDRNRTPLTR